MSMADLKILLQATTAKVQQCTSEKEYRFFLR